jgi:hypothetical protein
MSDHIDVRGGSGKLYRFRLAQNGRPTSAMSGTYAYVREEPGAPAILFVGETDNLMTGAQTRWSEAIGQHQATHLYVRLNISAATRLEELQDILEANSPVMNK